MKTPEEVFLKISNFVIKLSFAKNMQDSLLIDQILRYHKFFLFKIRHPEEINFEIKFIKNDKILLVKKGDCTFIQLYERKDNNLLFAFDYIGFKEFQMLLAGVLEELLSINHGFFIHASAAKINGHTYIFSGASGSGKSTVVNLLKERYATIANDSGIIKKEGGDYSFYQTPFVKGEHKVKKERSGYIINKLFFLRRASFCKIKKLEDKEKILHLLISQIWTKSIIGNTTNKIIKNLIDFTSEFNDFYFLEFAKDSKSLIDLMRRYE